MPKRNFHSEIEECSARGVSMEQINLERAKQDAIVAARAWAAQEVKETVAKIERRLTELERQAKSVRRHMKSAEKKKPTTWRARLREFFS